MFPKNAAQRSDARLMTTLFSQILPSLRARRKPVARSTAVAEIIHGTKKLNPPSDRAITITQPDASTPTIASAMATSLK